VIWYMGLKIIDGIATNSARMAGGMKAAAAATGGMKAAATGGMKAAAKK